ncbi:nicotinamide-nucleotide amidase [Paenibacillus cellulosilyticus]|uniref:Putative competence-damage inducible protein n=1 Tax=Paenibacillus cellulosilyticus TaxID=375489 RepID=A0A2V2YXC0_9BACL|nr:competence/damage-inducible protein A [Paenibacillus cellulosilyticus]PWW06468.1 nicotinamide-nucleotide amidase [Paenibacillus cellulosilyticus]QKS46189.1 competence/damage-inducible protein A [Paenibacillus cellulosilyticus]
MKAEIIAVGTELLLGQIVNTNAQFLSRRLADLGIDVYYQTVVGDNPNRIRSAIETARSRADLLLFTGGLGPTQDDLTKDVLAEYLGREMTYDQPSMDKIVAFFQNRGIHMVESNKRQATSIVGAVPLFNEAGLAVGNALHVDGTRYLLLPGPPREMKPMFEGPALTWLLGELGTAIPLYSRLLKFAGIGESKLEHDLLPLIEGQTDPTIAPYAKEGEVAIRVSTKAATAMEAQRKIDETVDNIKQLVGAHLYAQEDIPLEEAVVRLLRLSNRTMASAESCSGGLFAELITNIPGSSGEYAGGVVTYTNMMKHQLLGIPLSQLEGEGAPGAISESTAQMMAERVREIADADFGISITGVAGPAESEGKPVGLVYFAIAQRAKPTDVHTMHLGGTRDIIRVRAVKAVLYRFWQALGGGTEV